MSLPLGPKLNRVLILDDDQERHKAFRHFYNNQGIETVHVTTVRAAIEALEKHQSGEARLDYVLLDHDLGEYGPSEYGEGKTREYTGRDVADWMIRYLDADVPVRIHSWNIVAGAAMEKALREAGFTVYSWPFKMDKDKGEFRRGSKP